MTTSPTPGTSPADLSEELWSQILPGLYQGGTADEDVVFAGRENHETPAITRADFDTVVTAYAYARPADWLVTEHRFGFYDSDVEHIDKARLRELSWLLTRHGKRATRCLLVVRPDGIDPASSPR